MVKHVEEDKKAVASDGTSFPSEPIGCQIFHRTDLQKSYMYIAGQWVELTKTFGCSLEEASSEGISFTTSTSYQQKLRLTTSSLEAGDYIINYAWEAANSNKDRCTEVKVELDDTTILHESCKPKVQNDGEYVGCSGFKIQTLTAAVHTIDIDYRALADTAYIRRARISIWRCE